MVSPNKSRKLHEGDITSSRAHKNNKKKKKSTSVLKSEKIFFHIKNHSILTKYHLQSKTFGATIAPFLEKDVTLVVTDVPGCNGKWTPVAECINLTSPCYSISPATPVSGDDCATKKSRTRADAMLERIPTQTTNVLLANPLSNAISWNIPIYSIDCFHTWLKRKLSQIRIVNEQPEEEKRVANARNLEKPYLKFESCTKHKYRPEFKEVSKWPRIYTNTSPGSCPFDKRAVRKSSKRVEKTNATKKNGSERMNRSCNKQTNEAGYCEICAVHYRDLSQHVTDSKHMKFVCNDKNYADLDNCIKTRSVEAFLVAHQSSGTNNSNSKESNNVEEMGRNLRKSVPLHLNNNNENSAVTRAIRNGKLLDDSLKQPLQVQCNGFTNYHLRKSAIKSDSVLMKSAVACYDTKELLRETRKLYASCPDGNNLSDGGRGGDLAAQLSPVEDDSVHRLRSRRNLILPSTLLGTTAEDASKHRGGSAVSPQTPSPGSNHFLRSSVSPRAQCTTRHKLPSHEESSKKGTASTPCKDTRTVGGGSHFTRSRPDNGIGSPTGAEETRKGGRRKASLTSDEEDKRKASDRHSYQSKRLQDELAAEKQRKRLSTEEKFLEDNKEYYKVEMVRTKLRSTEHFCNELVKKDEPRELAPEEKKMVKRNSRLELLHQEAKEFMFGPPKDDDDSDESDGSDDDEANKSALTPNGDKEPSAAAMRRLKGTQRRTHAELFIKDNLDYYKFEMSNSRLRHGDEKAPTGGVQVKEEALTDDESKSPPPPPPPISRRAAKKRCRRDTEPEQKLVATPKEEEQQAEPEGGSEYCDRPKPPSESLRFAFETAPTKESWYKAFERFDNCQETYVALPDTVYFNRYREVRPYGGIVQKQAIAAVQNQTILPATGGPPPSAAAVAPAAAAAAASPSSSPMSRKSKLRYHKLTQRLIIDDKPRKSPRCHASTLAILSNITGNRRRSRKLMANIKQQQQQRTPTKHVHATPTPAQEAENAKALAEANAQEEQRRLNDAVKKLAKEADARLIGEFSREDCGDAYLRKLMAADADDVDSSSWHVCMTIDDEILRDRDYLKSFAVGYGEKIGDMSSFMESSQNCTSMESALDEELSCRIHEPLSRLCREHDVSCNSSDCGGSSTCEFLGFAEDGRHVSRRRKRKRANMTGWPPDRNKRKQPRQMVTFKNATQMNGAIEEEEEEDDDETGKEANNGGSGMESEGTTDDDLPLTEMANKKTKEAKDKSSPRTPTRRSLRGSYSGTSCQRLSNSRRSSAKSSRRLR